MINKLTSTAMVLVFASTMLMGQQQEKAQVFRINFFEVVKGKGEDFQKAVKAKTDKYNKASVDPVNTWRVMSGPRTGQYARVYGPKEWTYFETTDNEGLKFWGQTVSPFVANMSGNEYSVLEKDMSYNGSGKTTTSRYLDIWEFTIQPDKGYEWTSWMRDLTRLCNENKSKARFTTFHSVSGANMGKYYLVWGMDSLAELDNNGENWAQWFNKMKGSAAAWTNELRRASTSVEIYGQTRYMMELMPELSSK